MPSDFLFAIELSRGAASERMLDELAAAVFTHAGLARQTVAGLNAAFRQALADESARGCCLCRVRFQAVSGTLTIGVAGDGGAEWQTTHRLP